MCRKSRFSPDLPGAFRFDHVLLQETRRFASDSVGSLVVGVGRPNAGADVVSPFPLKSDSAPDNFWYERPAPPQRTGAYDLVLQFQGLFDAGRWRRIQLQRGHGSLGDLRIQRPISGGVSNESRISLVIRSAMSGMASMRIELFNNLLITCAQQPVLSVNTNRLQSLLA